jgi:hypothetical protein
LGTMPEFLESTDIEKDCCDKKWEGHKFTKKSLRSKIWEYSNPLIIFFSSNIQKSTVIC